MRTSIKEMKNLAKKKGGRCLSSEYLGSHNKLRWECDKRHQWEASPSNIKRNKWCPYCAGVRIHNPTVYKELQKYIRSKKGKLLTKENENLKKVDVVCSKGHKWNPSSRNLLKLGTWCPYCAGVLSDSEETFKLVKKIIKNKKGTLLTDSYQKMTTKMEIVCKEGHQFKMSAGALKRGTWCPKCADNTRNDGNKKTIENCQELAKSRGGKCLSKTYVNAREKLEWECVNQHKFKMAYGTAFGNRWCPKCSGYTSEEIVRAFFEQLTGKPFPKAYPEWLRNSDDNQMEFDGYNEKLKVAFEHHGEQHYSANAFRQTSDGLKKRKSDDRRKANLAKKNGVHLIIVPQLEARLKIEKLQKFLLMKFDKIGLKIPKSRRIKKVDFSSAFNKDLLQEMKDIAKTKGGKCLSNKYLGVHKHLVFECKEGHRWQAKPNNIKNGGKWCPECAGVVSYSIEDMHEIAKSKKGKCLSKKYKNANSKLKWQCEKNHQFERTPSSIINNGRWCEECRKNSWNNPRKASLKEFKEIAKSNNKSTY